MKRLKAVLVIAVFYTIAHSANGATPQEEFDRIYGVEAKQVSTAKDKRVSAQFAKTLVTDAKAVSDDKPFLVLLCSKAYDFGSLHPDGYAAAIEAMDVLQKASPEARDEANDKLLVLLGKQYKSANGIHRKAAAIACLDKYLEVANSRVNANPPKLSDALDLYDKAAAIAIIVGPEKASYVKGKQRSIKRLSELQSTKTRSEHETIELAELLLVEFDRRAEAAKLNVKSVALTSKEVGDLTESEAVELGEWYKSKVAAATMAGKAIALTRAKLCFEQFLTLHDKADGQRLQVTREMEDVSRSIESLPPAELIADHTAARPTKTSEKMKTLSDREAAEWVVGQQRDCWTLDNAHIISLDKIPAQDFQLARIYLDKKPLGDNDLQNLAGLKRMEYVSLGGTNVTAVGLAHLVNSREHLWGLPLWGSQVGDDGLEVLAQFPNLTGLWLNGTKVSDKGLSNVKTLTKLQMLTLDDTKITDAGLTYLSAMQALDNLGLSYCKIGDAGLAHLYLLKGLKNLHIQHTNVTVGGIEKLRQRMPDCKVESELIPK